METFLRHLTRAPHGYCRNTANRLAGTIPLKLTDGREKPVRFICTDDRELFSGAPKWLTLCGNLVGGHDNAMPACDRMVYMRRARKSVSRDAVNDRGAIQVNPSFRLRFDSSRLFAIIGRTLFALVLVPCTTAGAADQASEANVTLGDDAPRSTRVPIELQGNQAPILAATVDGIPVRLRFDLGDSTALVLQKTILEKTHATPTGKTARMQGVDGPFEAPLFEVTRFEIGGLQFGNATVRQDQTRKGYAASGEADGFLGTGLLKEFQIVIDYADRIMTLVPKAATDRTALCTGTEIPFSDNARWRGEPVTEADTDIGRVILWWDTGAPASVLRKEILHDRESSDTLTSARLRLGTRNFGPWPFQLWGDMNLPGFDGFLGHDFFARHVVCVDFPRDRVVVVSQTANASREPGVSARPPP